MLLLFPEKFGKTFGPSPYSIFTMKYELTMIIYLYIAPINYLWVYYRTEKYCNVNKHNYLHNNIVFKVYYIDRDKANNISVLVKSCYRANDNNIPT